MQSCIHSNVSASLKQEYGNCLFDMGRHGDALTAYETAYEHLRHDIFNLQLAKLLSLWGSTMARLGIKGAYFKLDQALGIAKGRDGEWCFTWVGILS